jgi:cation:H+ antiporter
MLLQVFHFAAGLVLLVLGAELLVRGASRLALSFGISPLVVGLTVVAFGTSAPELAVSIQAVRSGQVDIAVGNVVGSNVFNVLFILGACALIAPLVVNAQLIRQEVPVMIGVSLLLWLLAGHGGVSRGEAALLFLLLIVYTVFLVVQSRRQTNATRAEYAEALPEPEGRARNRTLQVVFVIAGLALLVAGARLLVDAAVTFATALGLSELVIGLTIVAAGTSLPEVATSLAATLRGERDIAVGNVIGSNTFNVLGVLGVSGLVAPEALQVAPGMLAFDIPVMTAVAVACLPVFFTGRRIARWEGALFLLYYVAYTAYLVLAAQAHDALPLLSTTMLGFVVPITVLTLAITVFRAVVARK